THSVALSLVSVNPLRWILHVYSLHFQDACRCPRWHWLALKVGCAGLILLVLSLAGFGVSVQILPIEKCAAAQENLTEATGNCRSVILTCPRDWHPYWDKCLFISQTSGPWAEGLADCSVKEATLLFIEYEEELFSEKIGQTFYIGLNYVPAKKIWKWINGSILNPHLLQITLKDEEKSCTLISKTKVFSDICSTDNHFVCQKKLKHV
uniref:C-type lectin domain-containing protein n=1 Tax=Peromyscus maniculatus bairdii TaxID=230844 RepID=A0A8C8UDS2_PERMB